LLFERISEKKITCSSCGSSVIFELIEGIECDWGIHDVIQCPNCQELFSLDRQCRAFEDLMNLSRHNDDLFSDAEKSEYVENPHC